jgi:hypothetical protein
VHDRALQNTIMVMRTPNRPTLLPALLALGALLAWRATPIGGAPQRPALLTQFLQRQIGLDSAQLGALEEGQAIVKVLDTEDKRDVAVFGIITADVPRKTYIARVLDFQHSLRSPTRARFGIFSDPAVPSDLAALTLDPHDVADLKDCYPGKCQIKLPATEMQRIREEVDWKAGDVQARVDAYARQRLQEYVTDYRARGNAAMVVYDDRGNVRAGDAFAGLLGQSPYVYEYAPSFHTYLVTYPRGEIPGLTEILYWSDETLPRLKPILSVTHVAVYSPPELPGATLVASKQIYADHYFEAAFELLTVVDRPRASGSPGTYLLLLRRFRFDNMPSGGLINIRGKVVGKLRDQVRADLEREAASPASR